MQCAIVYTKDFEKLDYGPDHPFTKDRFVAFMRYITRKISDIPIIQPKTYDISLLEKVHSRGYINRVKKLSVKGRGFLSIDTPIFPGIFEWAVSYTWASLTAADLVYEQKYRVVFNPCGGLHHAKRNDDGGFCVFNDVALAAIYLHDKKVKVGIVDIDAHAGDGTMRILYDEPILKISIHEDPYYLYPGDGFIDQVGVRDGYGYTINVPLPLGATDDILIKVFREIVKPALEKYDPDILILQSGVDGYRKDPLTHLRYTAHGYHEISKILRNTCSRIVMLGGGGYNVDSVPVLWSTILLTLIDTFDIVKEDALRMDPEPTKCDNYLCEKAEILIRTILETHPFFTEKINE